ncbi:MAG: hypothetical protein R3B35_09115 [Gemmatimonadales bacterium]
MSLVGTALLIALCIPIIALLVDSPIGRGIGRRLEGRDGTADDGVAGELRRRLDLLEGDVELLQHTVEQLREENQFLQRLLEEGRSRSALPPDGA